MRIETGVRQGDTISPYYDPMIAKLVVHADDRRSALNALAAALKETRIAGSVTNVGFLAALSQDADFAAGDVDTGLIGRKQAALTAKRGPDASSIARAALAASGVAPTETSPDDPWTALAGYSHFHPIERQLSLHLDTQEHTAALVTLAENLFAVRVDTAAPITLSRGDLAATALWPGHVTVFGNGASYTFTVPDPFANAADAEAGVGSMRAPMPGLVKLVRADKGDTVKKGQPLLILEAMKMEHTIAALHDGTIAEIAAEGAQVTDGTVLVRFVEQAGA